MNFDKSGLNTAGELDSGVFRSWNAWATCLVCLVVLIAARLSIWSPSKYVSQFEGNLQEELVEDVEPLGDDEPVAFYGPGTTRISFEVRNDDQIDEDLAAIRQQSGRLVVDLFCSEVSGKLAHLRDLESIHTLSLFGCPVTDEDLLELGQLPNLQALDVSHTRVTPAGLMKLRDSRKVQYLMVSGLAIDEQTLNEIVQVWPNLTTLGLEKTNIPSGGFRSLSKLRRLQSLNLSRTVVSDRDLKWISGLTRLKTLHINQTGISDRGMIYLGRIESLWKLDLNHTHITSKGLKELKGLQELELFYFLGTNVSIDGLDHLKSLKSLRIIGVNWETTPEANERLRQTLPNVRYP
ncbi:hypothetical protein [Planctomicrobium sp. SH527]|uniref:hypothetical protein n=1 Tax=Planctomicrobium sp. SH527 TaxID=3448123 RepID=UPI003F5C3C9F